MNPPVPPETESLLDRLALLRPIYILTPVLLWVVGVQLVAMSQETTTFDEVAHLGAGYSYLVRGDYRLNSEHPPLAKILNAMPLLGLRVHWPDERAHWDHANEWWFGYALLYESGNDPARLLFWSRFPTVLWALLLVVSVFAAARELYGPKAGLIALVLAAFCPILLGHGHLVTTDVAVTALYFLTVVAFWRLFHAATLVWSLICGILLGGCLASKYSAVTLLPVLGFTAVLAQLRFAKDRRLVGSTRAPEDPRWFLDIARLGLAVLLVAGASGAVLWGIYGFRFSCSPEDFHLSWNPVAAVGGPSLRMVGWALDGKVLPEAWLAGYATMFEGAQQRMAFAFGRVSDSGWWWYFPAALFVKMPVPTLVLFGLGLWSFARRDPRRGIRDEHLLIPVVFFWILALQSHINIGIRHIYPTIPFLCVLAGAVELPRWMVPSRVGKAAVVLSLLGLTIVDIVVSSPTHLAYFNAPARWIWSREAMLVDSNLDWGQDLGRLKSEVDRRGISRLKLAYFGTGSPRSIDLEHEVLAGSSLYVGREKEWRRAKTLEPGDWVAVSATLYSGIFPDRPDLYRSLLGSLVPEARIGHSILLYHLPASWKPVPVPVYR
jgi:hypothetical protein